MNGGGRRLLLQLGDDLAEVVAAPRATKLDEFGVQQLAQAPGIAARGQTVKFTFELRQQGQECARGHECRNAGLCSNLSAVFSERSRGKY